MTAINFVHLLMFFKRFVWLAMLGLLLAIPTPNFTPESPLRILRDTGRSILWLTTGRTGASLNPRYS